MKQESLKNGRCSPWRPQLPKPWFRFPRLIWCWRPLRSLIGSPIRVVAMPLSSWSGHVQSDPFHRLPLPLSLKPPPLSFPGGGDHCSGKVKPEKTPGAVASLPSPSTLRACSSAFVSSSNRCTHSTFSFRRRIKNT